MARYASGKKAWGYSDRSGFRYRLRDMIKEWNGLKVGVDEYEAKHPQLEPNYPGPDPTALYEPRPDARTEPAIERLLGINPFLHSGDGAVTVTEINHGRTTGNTVRFRDAVGFGTEITKALLESSSGYSITVTTTDQYTFTIPNIPSAPTQTFTVTVGTGSGGGNVFYIDGVANPVLNLKRTGVYTFNQNHSTNSGHPFAFKTAEDASYIAGVVFKLDGVTKTFSEYSNTTNFNAATLREITFTVASGAPSTLKYYCTVHGNGMGNTINVSTIDQGTNVSFGGEIATVGPVTLEK